MQTTFLATLVHEVCCHHWCGVLFGIESGHQAELRKNHGAFYCPNGHRQYYVEKTEAELLRDKLARETHRAEQAQAEAQRQRDRVSQQASSVRCGPYPRGRLSPDG